MVVVVLAQGGGRDSPPIPDVGHIVASPTPNCFSSVFCTAAAVSSEVVGVAVGVHRVHGAFTSMRYQGLGARNLNPTVGGLLVAR